MFTEFVDGPFWYFSAGVFVLGVLWRLIAILRAGNPPDLAPARRAGFPGAVRMTLHRFIVHREFLKPARLHIVAGYLFHIGLFLLLFFAAPHVDFYRERIFGFGWTPLPRWAFVLVADFAFAGLLLLWLHRLLHPVRRLISSADDHIASVLVFVVMLTGCIALFESFEALRVLHLFLAELLLIYFPFSSLMHTFTFVFSRGFTGATYAHRGVDA
jgi:nitrate reductase gamma subunit